MDIREIKNRNLKCLDAEIKKWNEKWRLFITEELENQCFFYLFELEEQIADFFKKMTIKTANFHLGVYQGSEEFYLHVLYQNIEYEIIGRYLRLDTANQNLHECTDYYYLYGILKNEGKRKIPLFEQTLLNKNERGISRCFSNFGMKDCIASISNLTNNFFE